jgi:feruloyl-CoA synthase
MSVSTLAPFREAKLMPVDLVVERRPDGTILLASRIPLRAYDANLPGALLARCALARDKPALAKRAPGGGVWVFTTYAQLGQAVQATAQWLLDHVPAGRTVMIATDNTPAFAIMSFAAWAAGLPVCPVSTAYGALGGDYGRLKHVIAKVNPALIFAEDGRAMAGALDTLDLGDAQLMTATPDLLARPSIDFAQVLHTPVTGAVAASIAGLKPQSLAAYMLTSGSTGLPKIVPITFDNLAANSAQCQQAIAQAAGWHDVMLDWLPWHHAAGAFVMRTTLLEGGTLYIDDGKPVAGLFDQSIRNMREIGVAYINNVPAGYALLTDALERDPVLRATFFSKMRLMLYGGAGLPQHVHDRLQALAVEETGCRIMMTSGYGATETVSAFMVIHFETDKVGIGLPAPGVQLKLTPYDHRYEVKVKGPNVTAGYLNDPENNARAFDEEGFYRLGDLATFHDPEDFTQGLAYAGRLAEEFKLANGNWVYGGQLRDLLLKALSPLVTDLVLCDDNKPFLTLLVWANAQGVAATLGEGGDLNAELAQRLSAFNRAHPGSSSTVRRALVLDTPPSANAHEISDKGTINRRAVLDRRSEALQRLYAETPDGGVIVPA